jgi:hypothetical protein
MAGQKFAVGDALIRSINGRTQKSLAIVSQFKRNSASCPVKKLTFCWDTGGLAPLSFKLNPQRD